jgi:Iron-containing redox enzyme
MMSFFEKLISEMNDLSNRIYETPEFKSLDEVKLTIERARFYAAHAVYFNMNRRDCWGHVQGSVPWDVKRVIWKHEEDELISDPRGGADHRSLLFKEAEALGLSQEQVESVDLNSGVLTAFYAWLYVAKNKHWLTALAASHILERRNDTSVVKCATSPMRRKKKFVEELGIKENLLISTNVHTVADVDHTKMIEDVFEKYVNTEESFSLALSGARDGLAIERGYRAALAAGMERLS